MSDDRLVMRRVSKRYRRGGETVVAVDAVDLAVGAGLTVIVGASGSGKTTLLNLAIGWEAADGGEIERAGRPGGAGHVGGWSSCAVVPQTLGVLDELSVVENIELPARLGAAQPIPTADVMAWLGLGALADRLPAETSLGEQQRTVLARAVCVRPWLLVADEPTSHQDEGSTAAVADLLVAAARDSAVLVATHDHRLVTRADAVHEMVDGAVVAGGRTMSHDAELVRWSMIEGGDETIPLVAALARPRVVSARTPRRPILDEHAGQFLLAVSADLVGALTIRLGDVSLAEELAHEAVARGWASWERLAAMDDPRGWLFRVGFNLANSHWRRRAARRRAEARRGARDDVSAAVMPAEAADLADAIRRLSDQQQRVVILRYYLQYDVAETASALGVSPGTVKTQTSRALEKLRRLLGEA